MEKIKSDNKTYYPHIVFFLIFGTVFFFGGIISIIDPDAIIVVNGEEQLATLSNSWPGLLIGCISIFLALNYWFTLHRAVIDDEKLLIKLFGKTAEYSLDQIKSADIHFAFNTHLSILKITTTDGKRYKIHTDSVQEHLIYFFTEYPAYKSKMWMVIEGSIENS